MKIEDDIPVGPTQPQINAENNQLVYQPTLNPTKAALIFSSPSKAVDQTPEDAQDLSEAERRKFHFFNPK